ncbi:phosphatidylinositol-specific phospholipase C domain-containing protein [Micromonospora sp. WMMD882]|uniref:phosphatidylinositol-specific phospholipase C domain-containing protein n=1 Tax=Micromonospora sp. WMMD882 TaxID=3015151 RepID=UPI00248BC879|nr:phosphatidylinositol-specific phospholipase C domain-containing protein [Micromonospora sp. WMMD882]WBB77762.1 phosphatidylinositol-specific phospholipase C domain-containing protein [Micromonospora sp. WMMD882]
MSGVGRAWPKRVVSAFAVLVAAVAGTLVVPPGPAQATSASENYRTLGQTNNPDWMSWVPDNTSLGRLSVPGTHDTLSIHGGDMVQTQEDYGNSGATMAAQLDAGVRAIDIRVRVVGEHFTVHHGAYYQHANFSDVLSVLASFLASHPTETVLMNLKAECTGELGSCTDDPDNGADGRRQVLDSYLANDPNRNVFYAPTVTGAGPAAMPTLGAVRGKVVLTRFVGAFGGIYGGYGLSQLVDSGAEQYIQDEYHVPTIFDIDDKWNKVRAHLDTTNAGPADAMYINYTSGASTGAYPYTVAGGTGLDSVRGVNWFAMRHLFDGNAQRTGVVMMDFPGAALIDVIISHNYRLATWGGGVAASASHTLKNIVRASGGNAEERNDQVRTFLTHVAPGVLWHTAVVKSAYGFDIASDGIVVDAGEVGDYRILAWTSELSTSGTSEAAVQAVVDPLVGGLSGGNGDRAGAVAAALRAQFPNQSWSVVLRQGDGGFQNWTTSTYGVSYKATAGDRAYLALGVDKHEDALPDPGAPGQRIAYYTSWSVYGNAFYPKHLDTNGSAAKLTTLMYAFQNIDPVNLTCMAANKSGTTDDNDPDGNDGAGDAWADYQMGFTADKSVDGVADTWAQPLKGNFNQLKKLKAKHPHLKVLVSIGGWTYSKWFSDAAATPASRQKFVSSCIDMFIRGNLPQLGDDPAGGTGAAAGVFDGIDIDWEFPAEQARPGNHYGPQDTANYTALLAEFRSQLDALGGTRKMLTAAVPAGPGAIDKLQAPQVAQYLDFANVMSYDMHGTWETAGPTNFQGPLYDSPSSPAYGGGLTVDDAIQKYLANGFPANKLTMGVPFYGRGWTGVPAGNSNGLYQSVTGPTAAFPYSLAPGVAMYKELAAAGKLGNVHFDRETKGAWVHDGTNFWSIETPQSLLAKRRYIKTHGLAGVMIFSLESDDPGTTLLNAATGM